jgi:hypothetical protein
VRVYLDYPGKTKKPTDGVPAFLVDGLKFYTYDTGVSPDWSNSTLRKAMVQLIHALGSRYDGDKHVAFWQVGFLGKWGEWHDESGPPFASKEVQTEILQAFDSAFNTTALLVRYPDVTGNLKPSDMRIGFHDDSFAQDTIINQSWGFMSRMESADALDRSGHQPFVVWVPSSVCPIFILFDTKTYVTYAHSRWKVVPIGGELRPELQACIFSEQIATACPNPCSGQAPQDFTACTQQSHASWQWDNAITKKGSYSNPGDYERALVAAAGMGYRYFVPRVDVTLTAAPAAAAAAAVAADADADRVVVVQVSVHIQNTGVAPAYYSSFLQLTNLNLMAPPSSSSSPSLLSLPSSFGQDLRTLLPSSAPTVVNGTITVTMPALASESTDSASTSASAGYGLSLGLSVTSENALRPIRFAVKGDVDGVLTMNISRAELGLALAMQA